MAKIDLSRTDTMAALRCGLPEMTESEANQGEAKARKMVFRAPFATTLIAAAFGAGLHFAHKPSADCIEMMAMHNLQYLLLAGVLLGKLLMWANFYPMIFKSRIMKGNSGNLRANMSIYRVATDDGPHVVLDDFGDVGAYNRANRSLAHLGENLMSFVIPFVLCGWLYPIQMFGLTCVYCAGRVLHATGYTEAYGKHGRGFGLSMLAVVAAEGLLLVGAFLGFYAAYA